MWSWDEVPTSGKGQRKTTGGQTPRQGRTIYKNGLTDSTTCVQRTWQPTKGPDGNFPNTVYPRPFLTGRSAIIVQAQLLQLVIAYCSVEGNTSFLQAFHVESLLMAVCTWIFQTISSTVRFAEQYMGENTQQWQLSRFDILQVREEDATTDCEG